MRVSPCASGRRGFLPRLKRHQIAIASQPSGKSKHRRRTYIANSSIIPPRPRGKSASRSAPAPPARPQPPPREQPIVAADRYNQLNSPSCGVTSKALRLQSRLQPLSTLAIAGAYFLQMTPKCPCWIKSASVCCHRGGNGAGLALRGLVKTRHQRVGTTSQAVRSAGTSTY